MDETAKVLAHLKKNIGQVIQGKDEKIDLVLTCWLIGGHILLEDVPGTGKTVLAKTLAKSTNVNFGRVQFTPDLLPSDIIGSAIYEQNTQRFLFREGPLFSTFFLADEINRASPRTQAALLESMAERQVTIEKKTRRLDDLFFVIATQNPLEQHGTFPLPEAQLDRFTMKISMGYPDSQQEIQIVKDRTSHNPFQDIGPVISGDDIRKIKSLVSKVTFEDSLYDYVMRLIYKTRNHMDLDLGASPRGTLALVKGSQAYALIKGHKFVRPNHIYELIKPILAHRLILTPEAKFAGKEASTILHQILETTKIPTGIAS